MANALPTCVVVGLHQNGLGVVRALGRHGIPVVAIDAPRRPYSATRYARHVVCADMRGTALIDTLRGIGETLDQPGILIPTLDRSVLTISAHRAAIEPYFRHSLPPDHVVRRLMNKSEIERFARVHGFGVPQTFTVRSEDDLDACVRQIALPAVLKPADKTVEFVERTPKKAFLVKTEEELRRAYDIVAQWEPGVVVQEWIPGPDSRLVFALYYFGADGRPLASFTGRKIRQFIPYCGTACSAEPWRDDVVHETGIRFFAQAGYRGFGAIEFKVGPDGRHHLIEPTVGRTEHIFALATANGVNLSHVGYCHMAGLPPPAVRARPRAVYVDWRRDMRAARTYVSAGELTWLQWVASLAARRRQYALLAWDDPGPIVAHLQSRVAAPARSVPRRIRATLAACAPFSEPARRAIDAIEAIGPAPTRDAGVHLNAALEWLCAAHDACGKGGVARAYTLSRRAGYAEGWQPAYPETTGYIIPTMFECAARLKRPDLLDRAVRMADWELTVQRPDGGIAGRTIRDNAAPVVFNTGMVLSGWLRAYRETGSARYLDAIRHAAAFLRRAQSRDGGWRRFSNASGEIHVHAYDVLVGAALMEAAHLLQDAALAEAARRSLAFTLTLQTKNGWLASNGLHPVHDSCPNTHTIGYATAGLLELGALLDDPRGIEGARRAADALALHLRADGFLPGRFDARWRADADWCCLTGNAQMAVVWWRLFALTGDDRHRTAALLAMKYVKTRQLLDATHEGVRGGIAGSAPVAGEYGRYQLLSWAVKFFVDAILREQSAACWVETPSEAVAG